MAVTLGSAVGKIEIDASGVTAGIQAAQASLQGAQKSLGSLGSSATQAGTGLMKLGAPLVGFGAAAAKVAGDFESQMNVLAVAAKGGSTSLDDLRNVAIQAGSDVQLVGVSASDVAGAMTNFSKAGLGTNQMLGDMQGYLSGTVPLGGALRAAIDLAAASELDLDQASQLVVTTMSTFGLSADQAVGAMDNYVRSADASVASVQDLADAMSNIGPTMAQFGIPLEDVNNALAILSTRGIAGAEAGTALKSMFTNMMRGTADVDAALKSLNVSLYDSQGNMRSMPDILAQVERGMKGMTEEQKNANMQTIFGTYGMKAAATLLGEGAAGWDKMKGSIAGASSMQATAAAQTQGFNASMEQLKSSIETFLITAGTPLIRDVLTPLVKIVGDVIGKLAKMNPAFLKIAIIAGGVITALGGVLVVFGQVAGAISAIGALFGAGGVLAGIGAAVSAAFAAIAPVILPVLAIIAAVVAAVILLKKAWESNFLGIRDIVNTVWGAIQNVFMVIKYAVQDVMAFLRGEMSFDDLLLNLEGSWNAIKMYIEQAWDKIKEIFTNAAGPLIAAVERIWEAIKTVVITKLAEFLAPIFGGVEQARAAIETAFANVGTFLSNIWEGIKTGAAAAWEAIKGAIAGAVEVVRGILGALIAFLSGDFTGAFETIKTTVVRAWDGIKTGVMNAIGVLGPQVASAWENIKTTVGDKVQALGATVATTWENIKAGATEKWEAVRAAASEKWEAIRNTIGTVVGGIKDFVVNTLGEIVSAAANLFGKIIDAITGRGGAEGGAGGGPGLGGLLNVAQLRATVVEAVTEIQELKTQTAVILALIPPLFAAAWTAVQASTTAIWTAMQAWFATWQATELAAFVTWLTNLQTALQLAWTAIQLALVTTWTALQAWLTAWRAGELVAFTTWLTSVQAAFSTILAQVLASVLLVFEQMRAGVLAAVEAMRAQVVALVQAMADQVMGVLNGLVGQARGAGEGMGNAMADGIRAGTGAAVAAAQALAAAVRANLPGSDAEEGPLRDLTASGRALPATLGLGIRKNMAAAVNPAQTVASAVRDSLWAPGNTIGLPRIGPAETAGGGAGAAGEATPVFVTNWPKGMGGAGGIGSAVQAAGKSFKRMADETLRSLDGLPKRGNEIGLPLIEGALKGWQSAKGAPPLSPGVRAGAPAGGASSGAPRTEQTIHVNVYNPVVQPVESDITRQLRNLAYIGVLSPAS